MSQWPGCRLLGVAPAELAMLSELAAHPPARVERVKIQPARLAAASRMLRFHVRYLLGKELRMWKYQLTLDPIH